MYSIHCTVYSVQCTVYSIQYTLYTIQCTVYSVQYTVYSVQCTLYSEQWAVAPWAGWHNGTTADLTGGVRHSVCLIQYVLASGVVCTYECAVCTYECAVCSVMSSVSVFGVLQLRNSCQLKIFFSLVVFGVAAAVLKLSSELLPNYLFQQPRWHCQVIVTLCLAR